MISYTTFYLIFIILCIMGYTDSGATVEEQEECKKNIRFDFRYPIGPLNTNKLILPKKAFKEKVFVQFQTSHGSSYFLKIVEKAAPGETESPGEFCSNPMNYNKYLTPLPPTLCMKQLREVYTIEDENDALLVIKWTYNNKRLSDIPKTFDDPNGNEAMHFALAYFNHMIRNLDAFVSLPLPPEFCQGEESDTIQNYSRNTDGDPGESSGGEMTIKQLEKTNKRKRNDSEHDINV